MLKKYGYIWITLILFIGSFAGHWTLSWFDYVSEQRAHDQPIELKEYFFRVGAETLENWQSEFLQLIWQVGGLAILLSVGSPQSKEGDERREEKLDYLVRHLDKKEGEVLLKALEKKYPKA